MRAFAVRQQRFIAGGQADGQADFFPAKHDASCSRRSADPVLGAADGSELRTAAAWIQAGIGVLK
jgi:hypothetical protein